MCSAVQSRVERFSRRPWRFGGSICGSMDLDMDMDVWCGWRESEGGDELV